MASVTVVLGAGGVTGAAFHAGVLTAMAEAGFDAREAQLLVGTSAGAGVAATLRAGFPPLDLAPRSTGAPLSAEAMAIVGDATRAPAIDYRPPSLRPALPSSPSMAIRSAFHPAKAMTGLLPEGTVSADAIGERIAAIYKGVTWPTEALWICAVDLENGRRVVFGRDDTSVPVHVAVQASSAIPSFFRPVEHDGRRYVDGGVHSATNADLVADTPADLVVIVSPMSGTRGARRAPWPSARPVLAAHLRTERRTLTRAGLRVLLVEPDQRVTAAMGRNPMDAERRGPTTTAALEATRALLEGQAVRSELAILQEASR